MEIRIPLPRVGLASVLWLLILPALFSSLSVVGEASDVVTDSPFEEVLRFFRLRGAKVPLSPEKFTKWRTFMSDEDFQRLSRQHLMWLKRRHHHVASSAPQPPAVADIARQVVAMQQQRRAHRPATPSTTSPRTTTTTSSSGGVRDGKRPAVSLEVEEGAAKEDSVPAVAKAAEPAHEAAVPAGPGEEAVAPRDDSVVLFDTSFGLADHPNNEFHIWRAPFPSFGQPWPAPAQMAASEEQFYRLDRTRLSFRSSGQSNYILMKAFSRVRDALGELLAASYYPRQWAHQEGRVARQASGAVHAVEVRVRRHGRSWPHLNMDESYRLAVDAAGVRIVANETWGALRGLETFSQLVWQTRDNVFYINKTAINDRPRFKHRGLLLDTARHFIRKEIMLKNLDAMAYNKMNVLHWHIVDDQSFPFQSQTFPNLSNQGAYDRTHMVYTPDDVREILESARERGIRVIPEFDTPGHTYSWGKGYSHLLTKCYDRDIWSGYYGPLNPARISTFSFLSKFFEEVVDVFHDDYIHLGADEVGTKCWEGNPEVMQLMRKFGLDRMELVTDYYLRRLQNVITRIGLRSKTKKRGFIVWQEARDSGVLLKSGTIVQVWKGDSPLDAHTVARTGQRVLYSACWYLDRVEYGAQWMKYYQCDPGPESVSETKEAWHDNILGGEACMWSEYQTDDTILQRIWPLTSATAERLWSPATVNSVEKAGPRLEEHRCRMLMRGIPCGVVSGPGTCAYHNVTPASSPLKYMARNLRNHVNEKTVREASLNLMRMVPGYAHYQLSTLLLILFPLLGCFLAVLAVRKSVVVLPSRTVAFADGGHLSPLRLLVRMMTMRRIVASLGAFVLLYIVVWLLPILLYPGEGSRRASEYQHESLGAP